MFGDIPGVRVYEKPPYFGYFVADEMRDPRVEVQVWGHQGRLPAELQTLLRLQDRLEVARADAERFEQEADHYRRLYDLATAQVDSEYAPSPAA